MRHRSHPWLLAALASATLLAGACSSPDASPWATDAPVRELPEAAISTSPTPTLDTTGDVGGELSPSLTDRECFEGEVRCGLVSVPQVPGALDLVDIEFRVLTDSGAGTPLVQLLGAGEVLINEDDFPGRPLVLIGSRGLYPGGPHLSCPEFWQAESESDIGPLTAECRARLVRAGIDLDGTLPSNLGMDVGVALTELAFTEVDLIVPSWRAVTVPTIADAVEVRRVVYSEPWFGSDRASASAASLFASAQTVWDRCAELPSCTTPGTVGDFLDAIDDLDSAPLDDVADEFSEEPQPIDAGRLIGAILNNARFAPDLAYLPKLHQAVVDRDASIISSFVQSAYSDSTTVNVLSVSCSLRDPNDATAATLPPLLRREAEDSIEAFAGGCAQWTTETIPRDPPVAGLTIFTRSTPTNSADYEQAATAGPVVVETTVGPPTSDCLVGAARAWFDDERVDDSTCRTPLTIASRDSEINLVSGTYDSGDVVVELGVPDSWSDSGFGTWWREADPVDPVNLDVYVWEAESVAIAREQIVESWGLVGATFTDVTIGGTTWLDAVGEDAIGDYYRVTATRVDGVIVALVLAAAENEIDALTASVLDPARPTVTVR